MIQMIQMTKPINFRTLTFLLLKEQIDWAARLRLGLVLAGVISLIPAGIGMSREKDSNHYQAQIDSSIRSEQQVKSKHGNTTMENRRVRRGGRGNTHSIIFVGGKKTGRASASKSNPKQTKKVQGELNPQPIPPGKQRRPE